MKTRILLPLISLMCLQSVPAFAVELEEEVPLIDEQLLYLPEVVHQGDINYVTGGIGEDEFSALLAVREQYNVYLLNARVNGAYVGDSHLVVTDADGNEVLSAEMGPVFLASLPPGKYVLTATSEGQELTQRITIKDKILPRIVMGWK